MKLESQSWLLHSIGRFTWMCWPKENIFNLTNFSYHFTVTFVSVSRSCVTCVVCCFYFFISFLFLLYLFCFCYIFFSVNYIYFNVIRSSWDAYSHIITGCIRCRNCRNVPNFVNIWFALWWFDLSFSWAIFLWFLLFFPITRLFYPWTLFIT